MFFNYKKKCSPAMMKYLSCWPTLSNACTWVRNETRSFISCSPTSVSRGEKRGWENSGWTTSTSSWTVETREGTPRSRASISIWNWEEGLVILFYYLFFSGFRAGFLRRERGGWPGNSISHNHPSLFCNGRNSYDWLSAPSARLNIKIFVLIIKRSFWFVFYEFL